MRLVLSTTILTTLFSGVGVCADLVDPLRKIVAPDAAAGDSFGYAVSLGANGKLVVGAWATDRDGSSDAGRAYLFDAHTGQHQQSFVPSIVAATNGNFGASVAIDDGAIVIGESGRGNAIGNGWYFSNAGSAGTQLNATFAPSRNGNRMGHDVAIDGNVIAVAELFGDSFDSTYNVDSSGAVYVFDSTAINSTPTKISLGKSGRAQDRFGQAVAVSNGRILVGAMGRDRNQSSTSETDDGAAYLYDTSGTLLRTFTASDADTGDNFGAYLDLDGDRAVISASFNNTTGDTDGFARGAAYVYDTTTGQELFRLTPDDATRGDRFGTNVAVEGRYAVIGANEEGRGPVNSIGAVYLFDITTGQQLAKFRPTGLSQGELYAPSLDIRDKVIAVGGFAHDHSGLTNAGAVWTFAIDELSSTRGAASPGQTPVVGAGEALLDTLTLTNTGGQGSVINITGYTLSGPDAGLFELINFAPAALHAGDPGSSVAYDYRFLGAADGFYSASLVLQSDSGDLVVPLNVNAVPEPGAIALIGATLTALSRRHRRRQM